MNTTWEGRSGAIFRIPGAPDWYGVDYMVPVSGNWRWTHLPSKDFTFSAARVVWMDGVAVAVRADGSTFTPGKAPVDPLPPPPVAIPPVIVTPPPTPPADPNVKTFRVVVVPLRYQPPDPTNTIATDAYNASLPKITQDALIKTFAPLAPWWSKETYGKHALDVIVTAQVSAGPWPACNFGQIQFDAYNAAKGWNADHLIAVTPYCCFQSHMVTSGAFTAAWNTTQDSIGEYAHELGHQFGLMHTASNIPPNGYVLEGAGMDQMCGPSSLSHFRADHKTMLGVLTPQVVTAGTFTLRNIFDYPDALHVGQYTVEYVDDRVWVSLRESVPNGTYGGSDTTLKAMLSAGQTWSEGGYTVAYAGNGKGTIK